MKCIAPFILIFAFAAASWGRTCEDLLKMDPSEPYVFHSGKISGLKLIEPHISSHGQPWVYATNYLGITAAYLGPWFDFDFYQGVDNGMPVLAERYEGAFKKAFSGRKGSIYLLEKKLFLEGKTSFHAEVVTSAAVHPLDEIVIDDAAEFLRRLASEGKLKLYFYPDRPKYVSPDDSDLINKAADLVLKLPNRPIYRKFVERHPNLQGRLDDAIMNRRASGRWKTSLCLES